MAKSAIFRCLKEDFSGNGLVNYNNKFYRVNGMLKDEEGEFLIDKTNTKNPLKLVKVIKKSNDRIKPMCPFYLECGGCQYQAISYEHELNLKDNYLKDIFSKFRDFKYLGLDSMPSPYYYRNKCQMVYKLSKSKRAVCGFYEDHSQKIVSVTECKIEAKKITEIINAFNKILAKNKIDPYDQFSKKGIVKNLIVRYGYNTKELMLIIVTNGEMFPGRNNVVKDLLKLNLGITTIIQNYSYNDNKKITNRDRILYGPGFIYDTIGKAKFKISALSFYPINTLSSEMTYKLIKEMANFKGNETVLDTYTGVGCLDICLANSVKKIFAIETNKLSYKDALENAKINNINNIEFINENYIDAINKLIDNGIDTIITSPTRDGLDKPFIDALKNSLVKKIVYISNNPQSLEKNAFELGNAGYSLKLLKGIDAFPRTSNLSAIAIFELNKKNNKR